MLSGTAQQVDETYVGGEKAGKRGRGAAIKALVVIVAQEDGHITGRIRLKRMLEHSLTLGMGSVAKTDDWQGHSWLNSVGINMR